MGGIHFNTGGGSSFDPANPGAVTLPATGWPLTATWDAIGTTFRGLDIQITDTASAAGSTPFRIRGGAAGTTELLAVRASGELRLGVVGADYGGFCRTFVDAGYIHEIYASGFPVSLVTSDSYEIGRAHV
jgi:hypothetical protein